MSFNQEHPYDYYGIDQRDEFERKGHPGRYFKSVACTTGTTTFTGSNFGAGGIIVPTGSLGTVSLSLGGEIPFAALNQGGLRIFEFSISSVTVTSGTVYVLIRNQNIR